MKRLASCFVFSALGFAAFCQQLPAVYEALESNYNKNAFEACIKLEKQVEAFAHDRLDTLASNSFFYIGDAYLQSGDIAKALLFFERENNLLRQLGRQHTEDYSNSLNNLAYLYLQAGHYAQAGTTADELIANDQRMFAAADDRFISSALYAADIYLQLDRLKDAESLLLSTLRAQNQTSANRGLLLNKLGDLYSYSGQYTRAGQCLDEALQVQAETSGEESAEYISTAITLGVLYMNEGKYPEAEEIFEVALSNLEPSSTAYASVLNNQALALQSLGRLEDAETTLEKIRGIDSLTVGTAHPDYAITLSNLGLVYADLGHYTAAEKLLLQALSIAKASGEENSLSYARKLNNLAKIYQMAGDAQKAVPRLQSALSAFRKRLGKETPEYATAAYNLGLALWRAGKGTTGYKYLRSSADIRARVLGKNHPKYAESILAIAQYQWYKQQLKDAHHSFGEVFDNYYFQIEQTFPVLTEEEKSRFYYTNIRNSFDQFNSFAVSHQNEDPELISDAYNYLINTKAAIMFATEKVKTAIYASGDSSLIRQFGLWQGQKEQIAKLYSLNQEHKELDSLVKAANALERELTRKSADFAGQFMRKRYSWEEIQKTLQAGEAAVEVLRFKDYQPGDGGSFSGDITYAFLVITSQTKDRPHLILLGNGKDLESKYLRSYRNNIKYNLSDAYSYQYYFKPLADYLKKENVTRLFFSPDGVYNQINLNGIENPGSKKFVIDEYDIRLVTNTRELAGPRDGRHNEQSSILIGFPKFNLEESELGREGQKVKLGASAVSRSWRGGLLRYVRGQEGIGALPGTQVEIQKIANLFGEKSAVFTGEQASERIAKSVDNPAVLHIATHGYFLEDENAKEKRAYVSNPLLNAGLILAGAENFLRTGQPINAEGDDGILTAFEAMNLRLDNADLVVLSACETGLGDVANGEGVYGLQRAFKLAGARSIVMSLWNVDDEATQQLMTAFYDLMLKSGDQHEAFRQAQQMVKEKYPSPFYWAAFIMVGI